MKKIGTLLFTILLMFTLSSVVNAAGPISFKEDSYRDPLTGEVVLAVYELGLNGELVEVPIEVYKAEMERSAIEKSKLDKVIKQEESLNKIFDHSNPLSLTNITTSPEATAGVINHKYYKFVSQHSFEHHSTNAVKVSNAIYCNSTTECPITTGWTESISHSFSATVGTGEKIQAVQAGAGYNYTYASSKLIEYELPVPVGKTAYVGFRPKLKSNYGVLQYWHHYINTHTLLSSEQASVTYPLKNADGSANGYYLLIDNNTGQPL
ncbi:hypothetical protein RB620_09030 [Paenibacillus sp. LHD-117]|uniref:DUF6060 domain-containing protein n=1 Tax=Paenibacillus sp. LHD-117 TaxID=3071412 RepID=UPI0027DFF5C3|nr:hypothetical protein [Paenibacillus sp. LHD-117]MDQ6419574.1 hypothetical protein [Paenibacillus sp. LHD-117]